MTTKQDLQKSTEIQKKLFYITIACGIAHFYLKTDDAKATLDVAHKWVIMINMIIGWLCFILSGKEALKNKKEAEDIIKNKIK